MDIEALKFPIGLCTATKHPNRTEIDTWIQHIEAFPLEVETTIAAITPQQLNWQYRPEGWTVREVIHHCADSHMNSLARFKLALTEDTPHIRPYFENRWVQLADAQLDDVSDSLLMLKGIHKKLGILLRSLSDAQLQLEYIHPEHNKTFNLAETIGTYAWHGKHHLAHIKNGMRSGGKYN